MMRISDNTRRWLAALVAAMALWTAMAADLPPRPDPPRLVNDLAAVLGDTQVMEDSLESLARDTGNQIVVVTTTDLQDLEPWDYALQLGREWGVGQRDNNNGVVVLIKPKTADSNGKAYIAVGYGLEGAIPDAVATSIVNKEMIPHFKRDDYHAGVQAAIDVLVPLARGEYGPESYTARLTGDDDDLTLGESIIVVLVIMGIVIFFGLAVASIDDDGGGSATWGGPSSRRRSGGSSWHSSGGSSSSWGGGGGFGGFGGGSFGGGGGGGSW